MSSSSAPNGPQESSRDRFAWNDEDVVLRDEDGNEITPRQAKELQLERLRSQVEEDVAADTGARADD